MLRRSLKFLHTMGAIGTMGGMVALLVMLRLAPPPESLAGYAVMRGAMRAVATWVFFPGLGLALVAGLLSFGATQAFHEAGWAWIKLATGILMFEGGLVGVLGPIQAEAERSAEALAGTADPASLGTALSAEGTTLWVMLGVATLNVALGVWRPRILRPLE